MSNFLGIHKSDKPDKKYYALFENEGRQKKVYFGAAGMKDYTSFSPIERNERRRRYLARHKANENWNDPESPGALSRWILWGDTPSVSRNTAIYKRKFQL
jgi:hypothetical protein